MKIELHIERLILHGLPYTQAQSSELQQALEAELGHLLETGTFTGMLETGTHLPSLQANTMQVHLGQAVNELGNGLARTVFESVGGE